ncbi:MAG: transglutaminase family protein [Polyangiaceae bacterium]|nr:transglutaminase family protein [Polyangiaceae bacterium]
MSKLVILLGIAAALSVLTPARAGSGATVARAASTQRFTAETPDAIIDAHRQRVLSAKNEEDAISSLSVIAWVMSRASAGVAERAIADIANASTVPAEIRSEAAMLARALADDERTIAGIDKARALGIVTDVAVLGPFRDTGGGLDSRDGPERTPGAAGAATFTDLRAPYSWGSVEVGWRAIPHVFAQARGIPLDLFVHPRRESCSFVASKIHLDAPKSIIVRLAASGQARLAFDGVDVGKSDDVHALGRFDRLAARIDATAGSHIVYAKICAGALEDSGLVRLRITDANHAPLRLVASADLALHDGEIIPWEKAKVQKMTTPLARVLAPTRDSADALLDAAIVRTMAGADDLKSPRAAGELDAFLQHEDLDADRVAMAAWVSPSGADKSARMYHARSLAGKTSDAVTSSFVDRRLVELHLENGMEDWAIATLRGTHIDKKRDSEAVLLGARALGGLFVDTLAIQAFRNLATAFHAAPEQVSNALVLELVSLARIYDKKTWTAASIELARRGIRGKVLVNAMGARGKDDVVKAAIDGFAGGIYDADEACSIAEHVSDAGAHDVAARLYSTLVGWAPNRAEGWAGLAREMSALPRSDETSQKILLALQRARELSPGDAKVRAELALRLGAGKHDTKKEPADDERWLTATETILARRKGIPAGNAPPDVADRMLHWLRAVRTHADHRVSQLIQYAREIVIAPRTQQGLVETLPQEGDLTEILRARIHKKNGGVAFPVEEHNDGASPRISWPELEPGDTVEVVIRQWTAAAVGGRGDAPYFFMDYAGGTASHPLLYNHVVVETLPGRPLYIDIVHNELAPPKRIERDERGMHVTEFIWEHPAVVPEEPLAPELTETTPVVVGSTFKSWADFRKWYAEATRGFTDPDDEVRRIARELTKGKTSREDKLRAIFDFVSDDIRYVNYVSGEFWLPNRPQQLLARREGDCDDKAILLITLLRAVGIEAEEVLVQTRMTGQPSVLLAKNAAVPLFDHGIAFLPGPDGGTYLDATSPESRLGPIPSMDARAVALRMNGPPEIVSLPASSPDHHGSDVTWTLALAPDGSGELTGEERHFGDSAFWLRTNLSQADARKQYVEDTLIGPWFSTIDVDKEIDFQSNLEGGQAKVKYKAKSRAVARREGSDLVVSLSPSNTFGSSLAPLPTRSLPVQLPSSLAPSHQNRTMRIVAPAGYVWGELPPGGDADSPEGSSFGHAHLEIRRDPKESRVLLIERSLVFDRDLIAVGKYASWRKWILQVDALMHREVRLVPAGAAK